MSRIRDILAAGPSYSLEFGPPRSPEQEERLAKTLLELEPLGPSFVSVTYGAGGSTRDATAKVVGHIHADTSMTVMPHLTCVAHTRPELTAIIEGYRDTGIENLLALGGDPPEDGSTYPSDFAYATELIELARELGDFSLGVAAFPENHPRSPDTASDRRHLADKLRLADFGITQFFFDADDYFRMVDELAALGVDTPVLPGVFAFVNVEQARRFARINATHIPDDLQRRLDLVDGKPPEVRELAVEVCTALGERLLAGGAPGLHLYTLNFSRATKEIWSNLGLPAVSDPSGGAAKRVRKATQTSAFGAGRRENHDASDFYARFPAPELSKDEVVNPCPVADSLFVGDSRDMAQVPDNSVALVVTSPPYFAGKEYEAALGSGAIPADYVEFLAMLRDVFAECRRVLEPGGRICVNVANLGRKPYRSLSSDVTRILQDDLGLLLRGEVIWIKGKGSSGNVAWGSFMKASSPGLRDLTERIVIAGKGRLKRARSWQQRQAEGLPWESTIEKADFMAWTLDTWQFPTASATRVGHPAPFPVELPRRCIELYTYRGDVVLDPFMGAGTTAEAALRAGRHYIGFDTDPAYVELAGERVARVTSELEVS